MNDGSMVVLGVDGGGTGTRAVLVTPAGRVLGGGRAGPSNFGDVGVDAARANLRAAVDAAWAAAGRPGGPAAAAFLGLGGVVTDADRAQVRQIVAPLRLAPADRLRIDHDLRIALAGGLPDREGVALIVGTGSAAYGRRADGRDCRTGGFGPLIDDGGSGYDLGRRGLSAVVRAADGRGPPTALAGSLPSLLGIDEVDQLLRRLYAVGLSRRDVAALAPAVLRAAEAGDAVAAGLLQGGAAELALLVATTARRLGFGPTVEVTAVGGLVQNSAHYADLIGQAVRTVLPSCRVVPPRLPAVLGAALLALESVGIDRSPALIDCPDAAQ